MLQHLCCILNLVLPTILIWQIQYAGLNSDILNKSWKANILSQRLMNIMKIMNAKNKYNFLHLYTCKYVIPVKSPKNFCETSLSRGLMFNFSSSLVKLIPSSLRTPGRVLSTSPTTCFHTQIENQIYEKQCHILTGW